MAIPASGLTADNLFYDLYQPKKNKETEEHRPSRRRGRIIDIDRGRSRGRSCHSRNGGHYSSRKGTHSSGGSGPVVINGKKYANIDDAFSTIYAELGGCAEGITLYLLDQVDDIKQKIEKATKWIKRLDSDKSNNYSQEEFGELEKLLLDINGGKLGEKTRDALYRTWGRVDDKNHDTVLLKHEKKILKADLEGFNSTAQTDIQLLMSRMQSAQKTRDGIFNAIGARTKFKDDIILEGWRRYA